MAMAAGPPAGPPPRVAMFLGWMPDEIRQRSSADSQIQHKQVMCPNRVAASHALVRDRLRSCGIDNVELGVSASVSALVLFEAEFCYNSLHELTPDQSMQRDVLAKLSGASKMPGNLFYLKVVEVVPLLHPRFFPELRGANAHITLLPEWFTNDLISELVHTHGMRDWMQEGCCRYGLRICKPFTWLVQHGNLKSVGVVNCGVHRQDVSRPWWGIGWQNYSTLGPEGEALRVVRDFLMHEYEINFFLLDAIPNRQLDHRTSCKSTLWAVKRVMRHIKTKDLPRRRTLPLAIWISCTAIWPALSNLLTSSICAMKTGRRLSTASTLS